MKMAPAWRIYAISVTTFALLLFGLNNGLSLEASVVSATAILGSYLTATRHFGGQGQPLFLAGILLAGTAFFSARPFWGERDLINVPQQYVLPLESYSQAALLGSTGILVTLGLYRLAYHRYEPSDIPPHQYPQRFFKGAAYIVIATRIALLSIGLGVKGTTASIPFAGFWLIGLSSASSLLVAGVWIAAVRSRSRMDLASAAALVIASAIPGVLGGSRGSVFIALLILSIGYLSVTEIKFSRRWVLGLGLGAAVALVGTSLALSQRQTVSGGGTFTIIEFLSLRTSGPNRLGPVIDSGVRAPWIQVLADPELVRTDVYQVSALSDSGIGAPWFGLGYLAQGASGLILVGAVLGAVAGYGDRYFRTQEGTTKKALYVVLVIEFTQSIGGAFVRLLVRELFGILAVALAIDIAARIVKPKRSTPASDQIASLPGAAASGSR